MSLQVTLVIPWLSKEEQAAIFPDDLTFDTPSDQVGRHLETGHITEIATIAAALQ